MLDVGRKVRRRKYCNGIGDEYGLAINQGCKLWMPKLPYPSSWNLFVKVVMATTSAYRCSLPLCPVLPCEEGKEWLVSPVLPCPVLTAAKFPVNVATMSGIRDELEKIMCNEIMTRDIMRQTSCQKPDLNWSPPLIRLSRGRGPSRDGACNSTASGRALYDLPENLLIILSKQGKGRREGKSPSGGSGMQKSLALTRPILQV